ncbi:Predicted metalloprotease, contains C-terminal PDZ domain [Pedobacter hartonius]|uniref:Predicted metalloprotease, contains C-terminal PDZ domain n=2 Tax=Pedobacter hartonius TaxID=425514 RepID=A0A1H4FYH8_9SPHI|nr:Predicted metalloprotease, contains C-terminal PDZ domain [Pedobacter hartonius]
MLLSCAICSAKSNIESIHYTVSFPNLVHHEAEIMMTIPQAGTGVLRVRMSRSSRGRYSTQEFGKNIYNVKAFNADGSIAPIRQFEGEVYEISKHQNIVKIQYTLFGNLTDGSYLSIDPSHVHLNMPASFMWVEGEDDRPIIVEYKDIVKYGWTVSTQMHAETSGVYSARNLQYFMDSPTELAAQKEAKWQVKNSDGKIEEFYLKVHSDDNQVTVDHFAGMLKKVVLEAKAVFGELPAYDFGNYTFINDNYPTNRRDGMEHRNSAIIVRNLSKIAGNEPGMMISFAHEFFHSWNVERIRPKSLEPFDFEHANMSNELWFAEGFTEYYGNLILVRSGCKSVDEFNIAVSESVNSVLNMPAALKYSQLQMSRYAVYADDGNFMDPTNRDNMFTDYYLYGEATALALDLRLRKQFNLSLDDYMRGIWLSYGKTEKPYTVTNLQDALAKVTGSQDFAIDFFSKYINGIEKNDYRSLLAEVGLSLVKANPGQAWLGSIPSKPIGLATGFTENPNVKGLALLTSTTIGTPLYEAGIDAGDVILKADNNSIEKLSDFVSIIKNRKPGESISITFTNRTGNYVANVKLSEDPELKIVTYETEGKQLTPSQKKFRSKWLNSKIK